jgi:hypothetical protein
MHAKCQPSLLFCTHLHPKPTTGCYAAVTAAPLFAGDAVVVFMRALCAVSQEELESGSSVTTAAAAQSPGSPRTAAGSGPRLYSLQKVVECAYANMSRIRLVWHKLWAVIAAQLVGASCHPHRWVQRGLTALCCMLRLPVSSGAGCVTCNKYLAWLCWQLVVLKASGW